MEEEDFGGAHHVHSRRKIENSKGSLMGVMNPTIPAAWSRTIPNMGWFATFPAVGFRAKAGLAVP